MLLPDVNILIQAYREDSVDHERHNKWFEKLVNSDEAFGLCDLVLSGFLRIVTNPRVFADPSSIADAFAFVEDFRSAPNCVVVAPGHRHWAIFTSLCRLPGMRGRLIPDAYLAAIAIESGSEWITNDGDFARFPGLRWRRPFA